jgi:hypothetical protein
MLHRVRSQRSGIKNHCRVALLLAFNGVACGSSDSQQTKSESSSAGDDHASEPSPNRGDAGSPAHADDADGVGPEQAPTSSDDGSSEGSTTPEPAGPTTSEVDCLHEGDGTTSIRIVNRCSESLQFEGSDIDGARIESGKSTCIDVGPESETLSAKRYWAYTGDDPGTGHYSLAEFTFNTDFNDFDWYNISFVDAFNLPLQITPLDAPDCDELTCGSDFLANCPEVGQLMNDQGQVVACVSPERDNGDSPVATYFEQCDDAYAWSGDDANGDDPSPVKACATEDWQITFCPSSALPAEGPAAEQTDASVDPAPESPNPDVASDPGTALGAFPFVDSEVTRGGTMTFTNVGAKGSWPRRIDRPTGDPACDYKDGTDTWGGQCCMTEYFTESTTLSPFDQEMTLILKAIDVKQLAVYQPDDAADAAWSRVTAWDSRIDNADNLWFTREGDGANTFPGDLTHDDCVGYLSQAPTVEASEEAYLCPDDPGVMHRGYKGSKLIVFLGSMDLDDGGVKSCDGDGQGHPGPWVAFVASELIRDGGRKWNGLCNCYSKTDTVGDGCGEINVFEVVMDNNDYSNREFASTGVRSYQAGHVGGAVCQSSCMRDDFAADADVVDACAGKAYDAGPVLTVGGDTDGCPVWRRPVGDRFFFILLDEVSREIQVGMIHPANIPDAASKLLPELPATVERAVIDDFAALRLPE